MPPLLPRPSLIPRGCSTTPSTATAALSRLFTTTALHAQQTQQKIPPESPLFINVPNPPQDQSVEAKRELKPIKGFIPVPRRIFAHRDSHQKPTPQWLAQAAPEPTSPKSQEEPRSEIQAWKRRMAAGRRSNMRSGVKDLWARKQRSDAQLLQKQSARLAANRAAATALEREDERLTRATVTAATLRTAVLPDPLRFEHALESRARTTALHEQRSEARRDAVQELYMNARQFIVTEAELEARVERLFAPDYWKSHGLTGTGHAIENIWDLEGKPMTVGDMVNDVTRSTNSVMKSYESESTRTLKRQKQVAEELTGGKME
ncbi:Uu.00g026300.m01.CDS01 [Anthostomella pinea]|uniref:Uu.00g026300.m01.CDS01 n=1 Tax=Anthostomella pinea TaxID=933095 RepID=A0AAI8V810_9PEZI|nr:Uu.00g026300.m01.CDS01 [Anthostomella pinea]